MKKLIFILAVILTVSSCKKEQQQAIHCNCDPVKAKVIAIQCVMAPCPEFVLELDNGVQVFPRNLNEFNFNPKSGDSLTLCLVFDSLTMQPANYVTITCIEGVQHFYSATCNDTPPVGEFCLAYFERWFYNKNTKKCDKIGYSGCSQRGFTTQAECENCKQCQ